MLRHASAPPGLRCHAAGLPWLRRCARDVNARTDRGSHVSRTGTSAARPPVRARRGVGPGGRRPLRGTTPAPPPRGTAGTKRTPRRDGRGPRLAAPSQCQYLWCVPPGRTPDVACHPAPHGSVIPPYPHKLPKETFMTERNSPERGQFFLWQALPSHVAQQASPLAIPG